MPFLRAAGYRFRPRFDFRTPAWARPSGWPSGRSASSLVTQLALVVVNRLATEATVGGGAPA